MDRLYIVIPAYNESDNIKNTIEDWYPIVEKYNGGDRSRLVIVNDGSKDDTYEIMQKMAKDRPLLIPLTKPNGGHGSAVLYGYRYAVLHGADYIFQTDSDGQTDPSEFHAFWKIRERYDAVIGVRKHRGDGIQRSLVEKVVCILLWIFFGVKVKDANAPFRLMKAEKLKKYIKKMPKNYHLPNIMITTFFVHYKERVKFREISFKSRQGGKNSINIKRIFKIGLQALGEFWSFRKKMKKESGTI